MPGLLWIGAVLVFLLGFAVGYAARADDNRRYNQRSRAAVEPPASVTATAQRVPPEPARITQHFHFAPGVTPWDLDALQRPQPLVIDAPRDIA